MTASLYRESYWTRNRLELEIGLWRRLPPAPPDIGAMAMTPRDIIHFHDMPTAEAHAILERWRDAGVYVQWGDIDQGWAVPWTTPKELAGIEPPVRRWEWVGEDGRWTS